MEVEQLSAVVGFADHAGSDYLAVVEVERMVDKTADNLSPL